MYSFERRLNLTKKSFDDLVSANDNDESLIFDSVDMFIMVVRTVTFVIQKELKNREGFDVLYEVKKKLNILSSLMHQPKK